MRIEVHTDNVGDKAANLKLATARAAAVAAWLTGKGIEDGRARNRRVVLIKT
ncbi:MAG: hypothetical protein CK533_03520 [Acidobacterium sp.]|nr:hypothetical protein [Acidobacteriota bacterium]PHY11638.1 MAG: hypothetical protein CK533_03520 [Acidobacterium sp.]